MGFNSGFKGLSNELTGEVCEQVSCRGLFQIYVLESVWSL